MVQYFPVITGSLTVNGNLSVSGNVAVTGSLSGTSSLAANSQLLSGTGSVGFTTTGSFNVASSSLSSRTSQIESVYATTGSNSFRATQSITGSLTVTGQIVAQTLNVQQVTSSIVYSSGSNVFGCDINSRQTFTGSFYQTGSVACFSNCLIVGGALSGTSATFSGNLSANGTGLITAAYADISTGDNRGIRIVNTDPTEGTAYNITSGRTGQNNGDFVIRNTTTCVNNLIFNRTTGAATFASSIGASSAGISSTSITTTPSTTLSTSRGIMVDAATTTNNAFIPIGFSWASSISTYDPTWGMALKTVSYNAGTADLVFYTGGNVRMTINNGGGTSFTGGVTATQLTANADNSGVIVDVASRHGFMKYLNYGTGLVGRNTETDGSISTWLGRFAGSITSPTTLYQDLVITNAGRVGIGTTGPSQNFAVVGAIKSSVSTTDGAAIAIAYGRTLYKILVSSNYDGGNAVRAGEWNVLTNNEGTGITNTTQIYNYNSQSATFSVSGGNIIISGLSGGNNQAAVFTN